MRKNYIGIGIFIIVISGLWIFYGRHVSNLQSALARAEKKFEQLQRTSSEAEETARQGLTRDRALITRTGILKQKTAREYTEISNAGKAIEKELREIIEEAKTLERDRMDDSGNWCYRVVGSLNLDNY